MKNKKIISIASCLLAAILSFGVAGCKSNSGSGGQATAPAESQPVVVDKASATEITGGYEKGTARASQASEYLGNVEQIVKPVIGSSGRTHNLRRKGISHLRQEFKRLYRRREKRSY